MRSKMRLLWCEVLIEGALTRRLLPKLPPLCVGIACSLITGTLLFPGKDAASYALSGAAPDSINTNLANSAFLPGSSSEMLTYQLSNLEFSEERRSLPKYLIPGALSGSTLVNSDKQQDTLSEKFLLPVNNYKFRETPLQAQQPPPVFPENSQTNPNQERFPQPTPTLEPLLPEEQTPIQPPTVPETPTAPASPTIQVQKIVVTDSTAFSEQQLQAVVQPFEGRSLTLEQLRGVADAITQLYLENGYITSRALLVDQVIPPQGVVEIRVLEGSIEEIQIEGTRRVNPGYVRRRVQLGAGTPLNTANLENQLRLLRADPLFENVEASLRRGTGANQSIIIVRVTEAKPFQAGVSIDNYSAPSIGSERLGTNLRYRNLTGNGDEIAASYYHTTRSGADIFEFSYRLPVNAMNGTVQLRSSLNRNQIVDDDLRFLNIEGDSQLYEISFRQPLVRSPREEFALSLGFSIQESQSLISGFGFPSPGADTDGVTNTSVLKFGQDYLRRDVQGAWSLRSLFSLGTGWFGATINADPQPDGRFLSWLGQVQRVQILGDNNFLIVGADIQLTPDSLLPSQQFVIGGGQSLRGYRQNIRARDNGLRFSLEDRITLERNEAGAATFELAPFFDLGYVWNNPDNPINEDLQSTQSQEFLAGIGIGLIWQATPQLNLRLDYALPLVDLEDRGTNAQDEGFYFSVRYQL
ncbi:ShlB/FhaC/HecB family hemolysin secretion/activation protein [Lyngbya aestuarii]|uniref:ShlB/FhaC/HecB family hemolysin secretion/activation protein n=1 Tax=Lyngbya aestuarii TaxID=118322 RepID=UPI00403E2589